MSADQGRPSPYDPELTVDDHAAFMALEIADETARADIECIGQRFSLASVEWYDLSVIDRNGDDRIFVERALRYMHLRGENLPYRVICHPGFPYLRRFEPR